MHLVDSPSPTTFVFKFLYFWVEILYVYGKKGPTTQQLLYQKTNCWG